eukprot:4257845-Pyramimonas_sp.AAC.1
MPSLVGFGPRVFASCACFTAMLRAAGVLLLISPSMLSSMEEVLALEMELVTFPGLPGGPHVLGGYELDLAERGQRPWCVDVLHEAWSRPCWKLGIQRHSLTYLCKYRCLLGVCRKTTHNNNLATGLWYPTLPTTIEVARVTATRPSPRAPPTSPASELFNAPPPYSRAAVLPMRSCTLMSVLSTQGESESILVVIRPTFRF